MVITEDRCNIGSFICKNGRCISHDLTCNTKDDCGDRSDELHCRSKAIFFAMLVMYSVVSRFFALYEITN